MVISGDEKGNGLVARIFPDPEVMEARKLTSESVSDSLQNILDKYNSGQPSYRAITSFKIRNNPFIKNATKKIIRAKMEIDEDVS